MIKLIPLLLLATTAYAHGDHSFDLADDADHALSYAQRHMHTEHHIDSFDLESFFKLHDLNMDGFWDVPEIQAVYGLRHHSIKEKIGKVEMVDERAKNIVRRVLEALDKDGDGKISLVEFMAGGTGGLPSFDGYRDLGHHYDEESEYFLHHEELYHSTPETQTDESYSHPEDIQHFRHHAEIEDEEDSRERKFEGLGHNANLEKDHVAADPLDEHAHAAGEGPPPDEVPPLAEGEENLKPGDEVEPPAPKPVVPKRVDPEAAPQRILNGGKVEDLHGLKQVAEGEPGYGGGRPRTPEERLRSGVPYKYKMKKGLRYDEF